jgi:hypothetical protein
MQNETENRAKKKHKENRTNNNQKQTIQQPKRQKTLQSNIEPHSTVAKDNDFAMNGIGMARNQMTRRSERPQKMAEF